MQSMLRCEFITYGSKEVASSRLRAYSLADALEARGVSVTINARNPVGTDVLYVQKNCSLKTLSRIREAQIQGTIIIFDVDDFHTEESAGPLLRKIISVADMVTTDTDGHRRWLEESYKPAQVGIVPDTLDYAPDGPKRGNAPVSGDFRVLWFGSLSNIRTFEATLATIVTLNGVRMVVITDPHDIAMYSRRYPTVEFLPWNRRDFVEQLQGCHASCFSHDGGKSDLMKSNNKMIASIIWGVPAIVSNTPEYARTARELGVEWSVFKTPAELNDIISHLRRPEVRLDYLRRTQQLVWQSYSSAAIAARFLECVNEAGQNRRRRRMSRLIARMLWIRDLASYVPWKLSKGIAKLKRLSRPTAI
jgi:hypothetical protein